MPARKPTSAARGSGNRGAASKQNAKAPLVMDEDSDEEFNADTSADTIALNTSGRRPAPEDDEDEDNEQVFDLDVSDDEEDEDDEDDEDEDDEGDEDDDDYEEGSDEQDEDEDERLPAKKGNARRKSKDDGNAAYVYESDEDDEDDEDEKMPRRKAKKTPAKPAKGAPKPVSDSESEDEDGSGDEDGSDEEDDGEETHLDKLLKSLPAELRRPTAAYEEEHDEEESSEGEDETLAAWGKSKRAYYSGDTADLEIGQEFEDAEDEEEAAKEIRQQHMKHLDLADFGGDVADTGKKQSKSKKAEAVSQLKSDLGQIALGQKPSNGVEVQKVTRDLSNATTQEKLKALKADSPELLVLLKEMKGKVDELKEKVIPFVQQLRSIKTTDDDAVKYMEVKQQVLLTYCVNVVFYMMMKAEGKSVKDHPVMRQLLELRYAMEKMRPLDAKLQYQIDRLLKMAERGATEDDVSRPNPAALVAKDGRGDSDEEEEDAGASAVYKAPKIAAMMYEEDEGTSSKRDKRLQKKKESLKRSEIMDALREEFSERPMEESSTGIGLVNAAQKKLADEEEEQRLWEEQRFTRAFISKQDRKAKRRREQEAQRLDKLADVGDFGEFEEISELVGGAGSEAPGAAHQEASGRDAAAALQRAVNVFAQSSKRSKHVANDDEDIPRKNPMEIRVSAKTAAREDDFDDEFFGGMAQSTGKETRVRRPVPEMDDAELPEEDPLYAALTQRKAVVKKAKQDHYAVEPNYGGAEDELAEGEKRGASHEIIENRGLRPHKKRSTKNPRVKKREQFRKAVIRRKGQVRDVRTGEAGAYGGESTGIKAGVAKSRSIRS